MRAWMAMAAGAALAGCMPMAGGGGGATVSGKDLYDTYCAACHGAAGRGDGPAAEGLSPRPADLSRLAVANGGAYPLVAVMAKIYGYVDAPPAGPMPAFGPLLEGDTVLVETAPGVSTPTPARLLALAEHVGTLQRR